MLLLVLVLVLIAFGLLVVALLSGSVLWAWVSVGVSVAAAAVLLADWLQRRSAVKAGTEAGGAVPTPAASPVPPPHSPAVEPATEVFAAVRPDMSHSDAAYPDTSYGAGSDGAEPAGDGRHDERPDTRETVVLHALPPSGSSEGPSGAIGGIGSPEPISSQSVTSSTADPAAGELHKEPAHATGAHTADGEGLASTAGASADADPDSETVKVAGAAGRDPGAAAVPGRSGDAHGGPPPGMRSELPPLGPDGAPPEEPRDIDATALAAELNDEVLVVDELPRYHLGGCRSLAGIAVIPLPAREAIELGFTPCSWCTPDRALSSRHRAAAR